MTDEEKSCIIAKVVAAEVKIGAATERFGTAKGGRKMAEIRVKEGESLDSALRRFKRATARSGVLAELRKREHYEKPSVKRKKKSEAARKRKYK